MKRNLLLPAIALPLLGCDANVRVDRYEVGVTTSRATCVAALKDYTASPPATAERVVVLRAQNGSSARQLVAIRTEAAKHGATGIVIGRPQDSAGLPPDNPDESWATALLVTTDSGLVHSACDSH